MTVLTTIREATKDDLTTAFHIKIGVKIVIAIAVLVPAVIGYRKAAANQEASTGLAHAVGGMALINIAVVTLWSV
ncbi:hypothetical protein CVV68_11950 [Arthrobacter livingstonensis]|uniref:Uncharacterized protein n=1 Tax=Arthrobacter livingstonensis TaxID=670078 RepID=A0A2V5LJ80_9MICC|nr:hypothetical protein [Arthrobacter livingstonensis]PYI67110.1 hypothetical protein CVV68_11950 [Arthrobacter livingstonensis]